MASTGKIVGGIIGFFAGGPVGAAIGAGIGHYVADREDNLDYISKAAGSSQETILNARAEMSNAFGGKNLSSEQERQYVFRKLDDDIKKHGGPYINLNENAHMPVEGMLPLMLKYYQETKQDEFMQILNRVLVYYYNYELGNLDTLSRALSPFTYDFLAYMAKH